MFKSLENAVAISAGFHQDARYQGFYDSLPFNWNGFTGIWAHVTDYAEAFNAVEAELDEYVWDDRDWIICVDKTVELIYANGLKAFGSDQLREQIREVFEESAH